MAPVLALGFLSLLRKGKRPKNEPIVPGKADEVFHDHELVENILSYLPALDLLVLQMVNTTCNRVVSTTASFQAKLFMTPDPLSSGAADWENENFSANGFSWNPFLMHYGSCTPPNPNSRPPMHKATIYREWVRKEKFDRPDASWKKMFVAHPTRLEISALVESRTSHGYHQCYYRSSNVDGNTPILTMELLAKIDRKCFELGHRHRADRIFLKVSAKEAVRVLSENQLRRSEGSQSGIIEHEGRDKRSISKNP